jgi:DMSO/TMAO reductase YedYZ molybdopterin-dependent catalytic subunit
MKMKPFEDVIVSPDTQRERRLPPGQSRTEKWPVLDASGPPDIDLNRWKLKIGGLVASPVEWNWEESGKLPRVKVFSDFHCVARWSRLDACARNQLPGRHALPSAGSPLRHGPRL